MGCAETRGVIGELCCDYRGRVRGEGSSSPLLARLGSTYMSAIPVVIGQNRTFNKERRI
jgi:hypothetical protein